MHERGLYAILLNWVKGKLPQRGDFFKDNYRCHRARHDGRLITCHVRFIDH